MPASFDRRFEPRGLAVASLAHVRVVEDLGHDQQAANRARAVAPRQVGALQPKRSAVRAEKADLAGFDDLARQAALEGPSELDGGRHDLEEATIQHRSARDTNLLHPLLVDLDDPKLAVERDDSAMEAGDDIGKGDSGVVLQAELSPPYVDVSMRGSKATPQIKSAPQRLNMTSGGRVRCCFANVQISPAVKNGFEYGSAARNRATVVLQRT